MEILNQGLYLVSSGLLIPVIVVLLLLFLKALLLIGSFYGAYIRRIKQQKQITELLARLGTTGVDTGKLKAYTEQPFQFFRNLRKILDVKSHAVKSEKVLTDFELMGEKELEQSRILMRTGPMLGLMGTLIPMGPALVGLAGGNLEAMAQNMRIAFSTTVVGVFVGVVGFFSYTVKRRWYREDAQNLAYIKDLVNGEGGDR